MWHSIVWLISIGVFAAGSAAAEWDDDGDGPDIVDKARSIVETFTDVDRCEATELTVVPHEVPEKVLQWMTGHDLDIYHVKAFPRCLTNLFLDVSVQINLTDEQSYLIYQGSNCSTVLEHYSGDQRLFGLLRHVKLLRSKQLDPFETTFLGIDTRQAYSVRIRIWAINYIRLAVFVGAIFVFLMSRSLVRNALFYYTSGCFIGLLGSVLLVGFIVFRLTPKRWVGLPILFGGWSLSAYFLFIIWQNFSFILMQYQKFVITYFTTVVLISFAVCYKYGPPSDYRSHNLAQWALQLIALGAIYFSAQISEVAFGVIALLVVWSFTKRFLISFLCRTSKSFSTTWYMLFPPVRTYLTMEEYREQGVVETRKALAQLRSYCRTPESDPWKLTSSLSDPKRFANFVKGKEGDVSPEELELYEQFDGHVDDELSDDSGEDEVATRIVSHARTSLDTFTPVRPKIRKEETNIRQRLSEMGTRRREIFQKLSATDDGDVPEGNGRLVNMDRNSRATEPSSSSQNRESTKLEKAYETTDSESSEFTEEDDELM